MRSFWLTGWLLAALLAFSAADPRTAAAEAPVTHASSRQAPAAAGPETPHSRQTHSRDVFTCGGFARAEQSDEVAACWSTRKPLLVQSIEFASLTGDWLKRGRSTVLGEGQLLSVAGRAVIEIPCLPEAAAFTSAMLTVLPGWRATYATLPAPAQGVAIPVAWLIRRHATPAPDGDDPAASA